MPKRTNPRRVSLEVQRQREAICATCEFSTFSCSGKKACRLWGCRWFAQLRHVRGACALGNRDVPTHLDATPRWGPVS